MATGFYDYHHSSDSLMMVMVLLYTAISTRLLRLGLWCVHCFGGSRCRSAGFSRFGSIRDGGRCRSGSRCWSCRRTRSSGNTSSSCLRSVSGRCRRRGRCRECSPTCRSRNRSFGSVASCTSCPSYTGIARRGRRSRKFLEHLFASTWRARTVFGYKSSIFFVNLDSLLTIRSRLSAQSRTARLTRLSGLSRKSWRTRRTTGTR